MARYVGLTALAGYQSQVDANAQATAEDRLGGTADPRHANVGEQATPYPWESKAGQAGQHGPYGPENQLLGDFDNWFLTPAGNDTQDPNFDHTPKSHAAPFPKGVASGAVPGVGPDDIAEQLRQSWSIHSTDKGASRAGRAGAEPQQDEWVELSQVNSGHSDLRPLDRQALSSGFMFGTRDRTQSMARQNEFGFDSAHQHRRYAAGSIPGNTMWLKPGGRPMAKSLPGPARPPIGPDSPFAGQDLGQTFGVNGAMLQNIPTEYAPPPQPNLAPAKTVDYGESVVEWY